MSGIISRALILADTSSWAACATANAIRAELAGHKRTIDVAEVLNDISVPYDLVHVILSGTESLEAIQLWCEYLDQLRAPTVLSLLGAPASAEAQAFATILHDYVERGQPHDWLEKALRNFAVPVQSDWTVAKPLIARAHCVTVGGQRVTDTVRPLLNTESRLYVVMPGCSHQDNVNSDKFAQLCAVQNYVLCIGPLRAESNQLGLLAALEESEIPVVLLRPGDSERSSYEDAVRGYKRRGRTIIAEATDTNALTEALIGAKVYVDPSWNQDCGSVAVRAAFLGKNVVVGLQGGLADLFAANIGYSAQWDLNALRNALCAAYFMPFEVRAREVALARSWNVVAREYLTVYERAVLLLEIQQDAVRQVDASNEEETEVTPVEDASAINVPPPIEKALVELAPASTQETPKALTFAELMCNGLAAAQSGDTTLAHSFYAAAELIDGENPDLLVNRAALYASERNKEQAEIYYRKALAVDAANASAHAGLGCILQARTDINEAHQCFIRALKIEPNDLETIARLEETSYALQDFEALACVLSHYNDAHPGNVALLEAFVHCLEESGKREEAERIARNLLAIDSENTRAKELLKVEVALPEASLPETKPEAEEFKHETRPEPDPVQQLEPAHNPEPIPEPEPEAEEKYCPAPEQEPEQDNGQEPEPVLSPPPEADLQLVPPNCSVEERNVELLRNLRSSPALQGHAYDLQQRGRNHEAWEYYCRSYQCDQDNNQALLGMVECGVALGRHAEVEVALRSYLDRHPASLSCLVALGRCLASVGRVDDAAKELQKVFLFEPDNRAARSAYEDLQRLSSQNIEQAH